MEELVMEIIAAILIFMQIFTVFSSVKKGLDIRDIKNGNDDRLVFYDCGWCWNICNLDNRAFYDPSVQNLAWKYTNI